MKCILGRNQPGSFKLFCFPYAGGAASTYSRWKLALPRNIDVVPVELPGRGVKFNEDLICSMYDLVSYLSVELTQQINGPYAFFGHSMGALIAYELALLLKSKGIMLPKLLFLSACSAPQSRVKNAAMHKHCSEEHLVSELRNLNGTPDELLNNHEFMDMWLPIYKNDLELVNAYQRTFWSPIEAQIVTFHGKRDNKVSQEQITGWQNLAQHGFSLHVFPGDHFFLNSHTDDVLKEMTTYLPKLVY